jgi:hypothetical protein
MTASNLIGVQAYVLVTGISMKSNRVLYEEIALLFFVDPLYGNFHSKRRRISAGPHSHDWLYEEDL